MYEQILTNKNGDTVKILLHYQDIYIVSEPDNHKSADNANYTKEDLISYGWIFPVEKWTPEMDEIYYIPSTAHPDKYEVNFWKDCDTTKRYLSNNLVCRTPEEAIALTDKMLGVIK